MDEASVQLPVAEARVPALRKGLARLKRESLVVAALARLSRSPGGVIGGITMVLLVLLAIFAPYVTTYDPIKMSPPEALQPPSLVHPAGTDRFGRDILTRIVFGARISLQVGLVGVSIAVVVGGAVGLLAGYFGGWVDSVASFCVNVLLALPGILLALVIVAALGPGLQNVMIAVGISAIPGYARVIRGSTLSAKAAGYVEAGRALGCNELWIIFRHILPNVLPAIIVLATLGFATAVLIGASVSYLGLGAKPPTPEWGIMVNEGRSFLRQAWWLSTMPGIAIMITAIALNLLGDGLRDALDPRLKL
ncbi:MAG: ABC transporter permease [Anaerolineales bacterium]